MNVLRSCCAAFLLLTTSVAAWQQAADGLRIVVIEGEDGVNIIQQKTAVQPVVEVRDRNNLPVAGIVVTFGIVAAGGGAIGGGAGGAVAGAATFGSGLTKIGVVTDAAGRAVASGLEPLGNGAFSIQATATAQGQTVTASISQTNFTTVADALAAGKTPAQIAEGSQSQTQSQSQSQSQQSQTQSQSNAGSQSAGNAGSAGGSAGGASGGAGGAVGGGAAAGGGGMGLGAAGLVVGVGAIGVGGYFVAKEAGLLGAQCTAEETTAQTALDSMLSTLSCFNTATTNAAFNACNSRFTTASNTAFNALGDWCTCLGPSASDGLTAEDKAAIRQIFNDLRSSGFSVGTLPACFR